MSTNEPPPYSPPGTYPETKPAPPPMHQPTPNSVPIYTQPPTVIVQHPQPSIVVTQPQVVVLSNCPACRVGRLSNDFTCLGIFLAIFFFPIGILCCIFMMDKRCTNCGAKF